MEILEILCLTPVVLISHSFLEVRSRQDCNYRNPFYQPVQIRFQGTQVATTAPIKIQPKDFIDGNILKYYWNQNSRFLIAIQLPLCRSRFLGVVLVKVAIE